MKLIIVIFTLFLGIMVGLLIQAHWPISQANFAWLQQYQGLAAFFGGIATVSAAIIAFFAANRTAVHQAKTALRLAKKSRLQQIKDSERKKLVSRKQLLKSIARSRVRNSVHRFYIERLQAIFVDKGPEKMKQHNFYRKLSSISSEPTTSDDNQVFIDADPDWDVIMPIILADEEREHFLRHVSEISSSDLNSEDLKEAVEIARKKTIRIDFYLCQAHKALDPILESGETMDNLIDNCNKHVFQNLKNPQIFYND